MARKLACLILLLFFVTLADGIVSKDSSITKHHKSPQQHQKKITSLHNRQSPQKCDLVCPGRPPLALPPNFMQNCSNVSSPSTPSHGASTSPKPSTTSTTEISEGGDETEESSEESTETATKKTTKKTRNQTKGTIDKIKLNHQRIKGKSELNKDERFKGHIKKGKVLLKRAVKEKLFRQHKHLRDKVRLDGCYAVCSEDNQPSSPGNNGNQNGYNSEEDASEESDNDHYIAGEDTPIEIIYVPGSSKVNQRPFELYQTNNYAMLEPSPFFEFEYDPYFIEGKQKKAKKEEQNNMN